MKGCAPSIWVPRTPIIALIFSGAAELRNRSNPVRVVPVHFVELGQISPPWHQPVRHSGYLERRLASQRLFG